MPFDHARHAALKRPCTDCHAGAASQARAGFPDASRCQVCHTPSAAQSPALREVAGWKKEHRPFPRQRVYRNRDFVIFSHARHAAGKVDCAACHGDVASMSTITVFRDTSMKACVDCHTERKATLECNLCHDLGQ